MTNYNGWTNYATWRVNLEIFDGLDPREMDWHMLDKFDLADCLKEYAVDMLQDQSPAISLVFAYAIAFISDVNWREIAQGMIDAYSDEEESENV